MLDRFYKTPQKSAYALIIILAIFATIYNAILPLHGDEAYYWMWSHDLQLGYFDHPPMIAYLIYFSNFISQSEWGVRLVPVVSMSISSLYLYKLTAHISDEKTALNAVVIISSVLLTHAGYIFATPDAPLILFWTLSLYHSYKAIFEGKLLNYFLAGLFLGAMMISKYSAIMLVLSILLFILTKHRDIFVKPGLYLAAFVATLVVAPMLYWNYQHEWISFLFQIDHGSSDSYTVQPWLILEFVSSQFGVFSPVFAWVLFYYLIKEKLYIKDEKLYFIALSVVVILLFFLYKSFYVSMAPSYSAPAYIGGAILVAISIKRYELRKTFAIGLAVAIFFTLLVRILMITNLPDLQRFMYKTEEVVDRMYTHGKEGDHFYGAHLTTAAYIKYYLPNHPDTDVAIDSRYSYYDMVRDEKEWHKNGLVLCRNSKREAQLKKYYENVELIDTYKVCDKRTFYTYRVSNPKQIEKK